MFHLLIQLRALSATSLIENRGSSVSTILSAFDDVIQLRTTSQGHLSTGANVDGNKFDARINGIREHIFIDIEVCRAIRLEQGVTILR